MKYYKELKYFVSDKIIEDKKGNLYDNTIYTFDIETTTVFELYGNIYNTTEYLKLTDKEKKDCKFKGWMYIWMFGIDEDVFYGRTWEELIEFLNIIETGNTQLKYIYVHNLSFEFQFLKSVFKIEEVTARKVRKPFKVKLKDYNIEIRCSYILSNCGLQYLPKIFDLPVEKKVGDLDYTIIRNSKTTLTKKELEYCEYDCLVVYHYILKELETYETIKNIPLTSTGHVRRELKERIEKNYVYKSKVKKVYNTEGHIYNLLIGAFQGGYTHANYVFADEIIKNVSSFDFASSYPNIIVTEKFPMQKFRKCKIKKKEQMLDSFAYLLDITFIDIKSKYFNNFISFSKCVEIEGGCYDNGRVMYADKLRIIITDVDFKLLLKAYKIKDYTINESYFARYDYLPKELIEFTLEKYVFKTELKNIEEKKVEYAKQKNLFNAIYGMCVTNTIRNDVEFSNERDWQEYQLTNEQIEEKLEEEAKKGFLVFSWGVWITSLARRNLLENVMKLDNYCVYCDTDSLKLTDGFDINVINEYNQKQLEKIQEVSEKLKIDIEKYRPKDKFGEKHLIGIFENDENYLEFKTMGAKKYAYIKEIKNEKIKADTNVIKKGKEKSQVLEITVSGTPKSGSKEIKSLSEFKDNLVFHFENTGKNLIQYIENQEPFEILDFQGNRDIITEKSAVAIFPAEYTLAKSVEYSELLTDTSSMRAIYREEIKK